MCSGVYLVLGFFYWCLHVELLLIFFIIAGSGPVHSLSWGGSYAIMVHLKNAFGVFLLFILVVVDEVDVVNVLVLAA